MSNPTELTVSIAGIPIRIHSPHALVHPRTLDAFRVAQSDAELDFIFSNVDRLSAGKSRVIFEGGAHWRARDDDGWLVFEMFYPPTSDVYCRMTGSPDRTRFTVIFGEENLKLLPGVNGLDTSLWFPYPFDQLSVVPALARRDGFLVHACGAVVDGKAWVFAGHSGDGKTTLSRLLAAEGLELLSDERVAIRFEDGRFMAYGTPWHGEGDVVSAASYPLGGAFILRKASEHGIRSGAPGALAAEFLARSIVPYYLVDETARILGQVQRMSESVPLCELEFSRTPGVTEILAAFEASCTVA